MKNFGAVAVVSILVFGGAADAAPPRGRIVQMPEVKSSLQLIDDALAAGEISGETAAIYRVFVVFGDSRLPAKYRGSVDTLGVDTGAVADAVTRFDSLSEGAKETLAPYLMPPFHEGSWHDLRTSADAPRAQAVAVCGPVKFGSWQSILAPSRLVRIWWSDDHPGDGATAATLIPVADKALLMFSALLGRSAILDGGSGTICRGGDDAIDIALVDAKSETVPFAPGTKEVPSYVLLQRNAPDGVEMTLVHELFHVMQYTYKVRDFGVHTHYKWLMEATAQWAQDHFSPARDTGREQRAAPLYLGQPDKSLDVEDTKHEYGAYLFFFYLARAHGSGVIKAVWDATTSNDALDAVNSAIPGGFAKQWPEFALRNWNEKPVDDYQRWDNLSARVAARGGTLLSGKREDHARLLVDLPHLSATYKHFVFTPDARSVAFLNGLTSVLKTGPAQPLGAIDFGSQYQWTAASEETKRGASIQAIVKKGGTWQAADNWTNVEYKTFCRQKPEEAIEEIVLIFANSDRDRERKLQPENLDSMLVVSNMPCRWKGKLTFDISDELAAGVGRLKVTYDLRYSPLDPASIRQHFLGYPYSVEGNAGFEVSGPVGDCRAVGNGSLPLRNIVQFSYNFAPPGSATHRATYFVQNIPTPISYQIDCPTGSAPVSVAFGTLFPRFDQTYQVNAQGSIKGERREHDGLWKWEFVPD